MSLGHFKIGLSTLILGSLLTLPAYALEVNRGESTFLQAPRLIGVTANSPIRGSATYQFTIMIPADAGEPLQAVTIAQKPNVETISFNMDRTNAFWSDTMAVNHPLSLASIGGEQPTDANEVTLVFEQPVQPGNTVTISLKGNAPVYGGIYQFGVTAFPRGENSPGLYLGSARVSFPR